MSNEADMSTPVTRGELREELAVFGQELRQEFRRDFVTKAEFQEEVARLATKEELRQEVAKLATKEELRQEVAKLATREELEHWGGALHALLVRMDQRIDQLRLDVQTDIARQMGVLQEWFSRAISTIDDKYADLPGRVARVEEEVFPGGPRGARHKVRRR